MKQTSIFSYVKQNNNNSEGVDLFFADISCWDILVICLTVVIKLNITMALAYIFKYSDQTDLIFLVISKMFWSMTKSRPSWSATEKN